MKLNERKIRNVVRRVLNEMEQDNNFIDSYNKFLYDNVGDWTYDGNQLVYEEDNFTIAIPCTIEDVQSGKDTALNNFDLDSFIAKSWLEGNIPNEISRQSSNLVDFYKYVEDKIYHWLLCFGSPSCYANFLENESLENEV